MITHLKHQEIDFERWDKVILNSELPHVCAQSFYLNATSPGWEALIIGDYESIFPLTQKQKFGFRYLPQPPFTSQLGAYGKVNAEVVHEFCNYIEKKFKLIEIELNAASYLKSKYAHPKKTFVIDYKKGFSQNQNTKRNLQKADEANLKFVQMDFAEANRLCESHLKPFLLQTLKLPQSTLIRFANLLALANEAGALFSFKVVDSFNQIRAIGYFISNGKHVFFLKGTNFDRDQNSGSMHFLLHRAITFFEDKSTCFDFGGGSNSNSLAGFYAGLGGSPLVYQHLKVNNLPSLIKMIKNNKK